MFLKQRVIVRLQYLAWKINFWMMCHRPVYPRWIRGWAYRHYGERRMHLTWEQIATWERYNPAYRRGRDDRPLPRWLGCSALGPLLRPWDRVRNWFGKRTGGRSHRCEFTDRRYGALHGYTGRPIMEQLWEQFIKNISA